MTPFAIRGKTDSLSLEEILWPKAIKNPLVRRLELVSLLPVRASAVEPLASPTVQMAAKRPPRTAAKSSRRPN